MFDFSKVRKSSHKVENSMVLSDFLNGYHICFSLFTMFFMLTLGSTKKFCVTQKTVVSNKKKIFQIEVNVAQKICYGNKKNYVTPKRRLLLTKYV